ncbi:MAG: hypothetical protein ACQR33_00600 [Candidatus Saccharibacteria bacterium]
MSHHLSSHLAKSSAYLRQVPKRRWQCLKNYWRKNWWHKLVLACCGLLILGLGTMYGIARWYIASEQSKPLVMGTTFIPAYAQSLGVDPEQTLDAILNDLHVRNLRLVSYWDQLEPTKGVYDFTQLDWQFKKAEAAHAKVTLSLGLRQPRWPECHAPVWATTEPTSVWQPQLNDFIQTVVNRYKNSPSLGSYQLENEYFLKGFGQCTNFSRDRLVSEYNLVKKADPQHPIILARSNNALGTPLGAPTPDEFGISIYKRVWFVPVKRYLEYPFPAWYYAFLAGVQKITTGKDMVIHELQAEAWTPDGESIPQTSLAEQNKSFDAAIFKNRVEYGKATGMRQIYLWGSEYWYYRLTVLHDPSLWNVAEQTFNNK